MAGYNGGRKNGVNVSQYIANLNKEPSAFEVARSEEQNYTVDDESLAQFTNADFFDFDAGEYLGEANGAAGGLRFDEGEKAEKQKPDAETTNNGLDFIHGNFPLQAVNPYEINTTIAQQPQQQPPLYPDFASQQPLPIPPYQAASPSTSTAYPPYPPQPKPTTPAATHASPTDSTSDPARALAEEDKRRRNTAASARFRVKKKQREQALEQKTQELEKAKQVLEQRVGQLETENEWLRGLVVEKNGAGAAREQRVVDSKPESGKDGVGTKA